MTIVLWVLGLWLLGTLLFVGSAVLMGYLNVKSRPREEMVWCHKHGHFRKQHVLQMGMAEVCPSCYLEAIQNKDGKTVSLFR